MLKTKQDIVQKIHLIISVIIVVPVAFVYAFYPDSQFELFPKTVDEFNFYKAIMGLYLGFSTVWVLGIFKATMLETAIISNLVFMFGLGFGRVLSFFLDGEPTLSYVFGMFAELFLGCYGVWVLKTLKH